MVIAYEPPRDIWEVNRTLRLDEPLDGDRDPRWVDTEAARGEYSLDRICRALGVDRAKRILTAPDHGYYLFCGHRGRAGAKAAVGLPFLVNVFAHFSTAFKTNATYKEELRRTVRNHFTAFSDGFNLLINAAEDRIRRRILFVMDGTDRLGGDDAHAFFVADVHQLQQGRGVFLYCAPVHLAYEGTSVPQNFTDIFGLPMIKVTNSDGARNDKGYDALRGMLHRRAAPELFDDGVTDYLIEHGGGHPRDLLRLLFNAFKHAEHDRFDGPSARRAVREMAADYRRFLRPNDYRLLAAIDAGQSPAADTGRVNDLLYNLALLEYNEFYWLSHPVIRTTPEYRAARDAIDLGE